MNGEHIFRGAALGLALVLALAPYRREIAAAAGRALEAAKAHGGAISRIAAVVLLLVAAIGVVPMPKLPTIPVPSVAVETPSVEMQAIVQDVAACMRSFGPIDRAAWAESWNKAAIVVAGDAVGPEVAFTDTRSLRAYTALVLDIAWRRIQGKVPGTNEELRVAVEAAYAKAIGVAIVSVTKETRDRYAEFARAMAWAGMNKG